MAKEKQKKTKRPTAAKRLIQSVKKRDENRLFKSKMRTAIRRLQDELKKDSSDNLQEKLNLVYSLLDKSVGRGILKKNKASRVKSRLTAKVAAQ